MKCPSTAELYERTELAESPHVQNCPRCAARLRALAEFLQPAGEPSDVSFDEVDRELRRRLAQDIGSAAPTDARHRPRLSAPFRMRSLLLGSAAAAALLLLFLRTPSTGPETPTTRSGSEAETPRLLLSENSRWNGSSLEIAWSTVPEARSYQVVVYDSQLRELLSQEVVGAERWASELDTPGTAAVWVRVRALGKGGLLMESDLIALSAR